MGTDMDKDMDKPMDTGTEWLVLHPIDSEQTVGQEAMATSRSFTSISWVLGDMVRATYVSV